LRRAFIKNKASFVTVNKTFCLKARNLYLF
jgi:hypothetical protein